MRARIRRFFCPSFRRPLPVFFTPTVNLTFQKTSSPDCIRVRGRSRVVKTYHSQALLGKAPKP